MKRSILLASLALFLAACGAKDNTEPPAPLVEFQPKVEVAHVWSASAGDGEEELILGLVPAVDGSRVFAVGREGLVSAWEVKTGELAWQTETQIKPGGGPGVGEKVVAVGSTEGFVVALSAEDGQVVWKQYVNGAVIAPPAVADGVVVVRTSDGGLSGLSAADGHQLWKISRDVPRLSLRGNASPVIDDGKIFAGFDDGSLIAVSLDSGRVLWKQQIGKPNGEGVLSQMLDLDGEPLAHFGFVYAVTYQGKLTSLIAGSGQPLWKIPMSSYTGVSYADGKLFVTDNNSVVHAVTAASGELLWKQAAMRARFLTRPTPFHGTIVVGDFAGYLHFLSQQTGELVARVQADGARISASPVVAGDTLIVFSDEGELDAYRFPAAQ